MVWGMEQGGRPTSELPAHLMNHAVRMEATGGAARVIYHAHPANTVALTFVLPLTDRDFSRALWKSETECPIVFPRGLGVVPWMVPGGAEIALASCEKMREYDAVIWAHHGMFVAGRDFDEAFGLMHTVEKAAEICVLALSCGGIAQSIPDAGLLAVAEAFGVEIRREFLEL
jgi:rhamnulose-1-phosphate aldolase